MKDVALEHYVDQFDFAHTSLKEIEMRGYFFNAIMFFLAFAGALVITIWLSRNERIGRVRPNRRKFRAGVADRRNGAKRRGSIMAGFG